MVVKHFSWILIVTLSILQVSLEASVAGSEQKRAQAPQNPPSAPASPAAPRPQKPLDPNLNYAPAYTSIGSPAQAPGLVVPPSQPQPPSSPGASVDGPVIGSGPVPPISGSNANGDNDEDEGPHTLAPKDPSLHQQFSAVVSGLVPDGGAPVAPQSVPAAAAVEEEVPAASAAGSESGVEQEAGEVSGGAGAAAEEAEAGAAPASNEVDPDPGFGVAPAEDSDKDKKTAAEAENEDDNSEEEDESSVRSGKRVRVPRQTFNRIQENVRCGYYRMKDAQIISIQSVNFNYSEYSNNEACSWRFFGHHCTLKASCPCFDLPTTANCFGDYLKITDTYTFAHKFCGTISPQGTYKSTTNNLKVKFHSDPMDAGTGFKCYVTCTGPGKLDPVLPVVTCPNDLISSTTIPPNCPPTGPCIIPPVTAPPGTRLNSAQGSSSGGAGVPGGSRVPVSSGNGAPGLPSPLHEEDEDGHVAGSSNNKKPSGGVVAESQPLKIVGETPVTSAPTDCTAFGHCIRNKRDVN